MRILVSIFFIIVLIVSIILGTQNTISKNTKISNSIQIENPQIELEKQSSLFLDNECIPQSIPTTVLKSVNFTEYNGEEKANRILFDYLTTNYKTELEISSKTYITVENFNVKNIRAFEYDLDSDGNNEIIGIPYNSFAFGGGQNTELFILKKFDKSYKEIGSLTYSYFANIVTILQEKTNNYYNIQFREQANIPSPYHIIRYNEVDKYHFVYFCH